MVIYLFFDIFPPMEVLIHSPNFYLHINDAVVFIQLCINGIIEIASQFKI